MNTQGVPRHAIIGVIIDLLLLNSFGGSNLYEWEVNL